MRPLAILAAVLWMSTAANGAEIEILLRQSNQVATVENSGPAVKPTIVVVGRVDRSSDPVRKTKGLKLNGVRLTETMLSESVLILRPDATASWGYHAGFDIFREPHYRNGRRIDPRTLVEYEKWKYDSLEEVRRVGGDMNLLRLVHGKQVRPAQYKIAFPPPITIRTLKVKAICDRIGRPGLVIAVRIFAGPDRRRLIAETLIGPDQKTKRFPARFNDLEHHRIWLELSAKAADDTPVDLYRILFEAELETTGLKLPKLTTGSNTLTFGDDEDSSHQARVVLQWPDRPGSGRIFDDFEDRHQWDGLRLIDDAKSGESAFTGNRFARASFPANGRDTAVTRMFQSLDLSEVNRVGIATRLQRSAPMRAILLGLRNGQTPYQYLRLRPGRRWRYQSFDISKFHRDNITAINVYWAATIGFSRPEPCIYDIDSLGFWHEPNDTKTPELPAHVAEHRSSVDEQQSPVRPIPPIQEWFPLGFYDTTCRRSDQECRWLFDQMNKLNMNTIYISNGTLDGLKRILPLAEARGIRLVYQGSGERSLYYLQLATPEARQHSLEQVIIPQARRLLPGLRDRWGIAAWSLSEEIRPETALEMKPFYELARELAPNQPPTVLHNDLGAARVDLATNRPLVVTHDFYPFFWSPRSGPSNPRRSVPAYRKHVRDFYRAAREHGASLWMMGQAWGTAERRPLQPPHYGDRGGMRTPQPDEIKLQGWLAIAEGATGLFFFAAVPKQPGEHHLWDAGWTETANTRAAGELFTRIRQVAPLLCRLERDHAEEGFVSTSNPKVIANSFVKRKPYAGKGRYVVLASTDGFKPKTFDLQISSRLRVFDLVKRQELTRKKGMVLRPGEGTLLLIGAQGHYKVDCRLIDDELSKWQ